MSLIGWANWTIPFALNGAKGFAPLNTNVHDLRITADNDLNNLRFGIKKFFRHAVYSREFSYPIIAGLRRCD